MAKGRGSNVWKLYEALDLSKDNDEIRAGNHRKQIAFYDDGVGTESFKPLKIIGGAFGWGLQRNVCQLYASLCRAYRCNPDGDEQDYDRIYCFGFSRGGYTVRMLAGLITCCGILREAHTMSDRDLMKKIDKAYKVFRGQFKRLTRSKIPSEPDPKVIEACRQFREDNSYNIGEDRQPYIKFIGVWDTVAAVGLPFDGITDAWNYLIYPFKFPNHKLASQVQHACQALAIDDERKSFHPILWNEESQKDKERIEQVWFTGMHSNVGGGYPRHGLSLVPLNWMIKNARAAGLHFDEVIRQSYLTHENIHDKMHDSRSFLGLFYRYHPRFITEMCEKNQVDVQIDSSVSQRIGLSTQGYAPGNVPPKNLHDRPDSFKDFCAPINDSRSLVKVRQGLHWTMIISLAAVGIVVYKADDWGLKGELIVTKSVVEGTEKVMSYIPFLGNALCQFFKVFYTNYWFAAIVMIITTLLLFLSRVIRRKQLAVYNNFWSPKRSLLSSCEHSHDDEGKHTHA